MLARLIQNYGKGAPPSNIESQNEEQHTRHLLYPNVNFSEFSSSPPPTPIGSPPTRATPFDDRGGLELNEARDVRIIIAQDACGVVDRPLVLFDSLHPEEYSIPPPQSSEHHRQPSITTNRRSSQDHGLSGNPRNRSFTISGPSESWSRTGKDPENSDRLSQLLDCMFGVANSAKIGSTTKMHVLMANQNPDLPFRHAEPVSPTQQSRGRIPLSRARTSSQFATAQRPKFSDRDAYSQHDIVLVTRMFSVNLSSSTDARRGVKQDAASIQKVQEVVGSPIEGPNGAEQFFVRKQKLVEKKTPMYAIGLVFLLPRAGEPKQSTYQSRPASRASHALISPPNSYGSGKMSPWSFVDTIPEALSPRRNSTHHTDWRVEAIVDNWDVILRSLSNVEEPACAEIVQLLQEIDAALAQSAANIPKGPKEQRTNQRTILIRTSHALAEVDQVRKCVDHTLQRICYALRIPRAANGLSFLEGRWLDEARYLSRVCQGKQQASFIPNLLTAFLGTHLHWIERVGTDGRLHRRGDYKKHRSDIEKPTARTVIISDKRSLARRFVFLLASFLPPFTAQDVAYSSQGSSSLGAIGHGVSDSTPKITLSGHESLRRIARRQAARDLGPFSQSGGIALSTSASSADSLSSRRASSRPPPSMVRKGSDAASIRTPLVLALPEARDSLRKAGAINSSLASNPSTPLAHITLPGDGYFPEGAIGSASDSMASADLARILRRDSTSLTRPAAPITTWGSLLNNVSGFLGRKRDASEPFGPAKQSERRRSSTAPNSDGAGVGNRQRRRSSEANDMAIEGIGDGVDEPNLLATTTNSDVGRRHSSDLAVGVGAAPPRLHIDNNDGVVDVDVNLPGFLGWTRGTDAWSSPELSGFTSSIASMDGTHSTHSFRPYSTTPDRTSASGIGNIAGYLKRYHEDFGIQAVKDYSGLIDDVKESMLSDLVTHENRSASNKPDSIGKPWLNVSKTVIADLRTLTIRVLTLQVRRDAMLLTSSNPQSSDPKERDAGKTSVPSNGSAEKNNVLEPGSHRILDESVSGPDSILAEAVERILGSPGVVDEMSTSMRGAHARSTSSGTIASGQATPPNPSTLSRHRNYSQMSQATRYDLRQAMVGAMADIIRSVSDDLHSTEFGRDIQTGTGPPVISASPQSAGDNVLREGVREWLTKNEQKLSL